MTRIASLLATGFLLLSFAATLSCGQDKTQNKQVGEAAKSSIEVPPQQDVIDATAAVMPGKVHAQLAKLEGKWKVNSTLSIEGMEPESSEGEVELQMILGGRFVQETGEGTLMGFPVEHSRLWGYNNGTKKYQAVWLYTMSTGFLILDGTSNDEGKSIQWTGHFDNESGIREEIGATTKFIDNNQFEIELAAGKMPDGTAGPKMKAVYTRAK